MNNACNLLISFKIEKNTTQYRGKRHLKMAIFIHYIQNLTLTYRRP